MVATNDAHYLRREDAEAHDVLLAIGTGADLDDPKRFRFTGQESYVKSEAGNARSSSPTTRRRSTNTQRVADTLRVRLREALLPARAFPRPDGVRHRRGAAGAPGPGGRRAHATATRCRRRGRSSGWTYELGVINTAGYAGYFLIVQDFIAAARERGIPVGPGRGSAAGSHRGVRAPHHRRLTRSGSTCSSSGSSIPSACRCPTSTWTSASSAGAR